MSDPAARCLAVLCHDVLFATLALEEANDDTWRDFAKRRLVTHRAAWEGKPVPTPAQLDEWVVTMTRAFAAHGVPKFVSMHELADAITLAGGSRGLKSLFSSKPSEKDIDRVRRLGAIAARMSAASMAANGALSLEEVRLIAAFAASLGLGPDDESVLARTPAAAPDVTDLAGEIEPKQARMLVRGAWFAAIQDGLDPADEGAVAVMANRIGVGMEESGSLGVKVKEEGHERHVLAKATLELLAFVMRDELPRALPFAHAVADLGVPQPFRDSALASFHGPPPMPQTKPQGKAGRQAATAMAWAVAIESNPTMTRKAVLASRLDGAAAAVGAGEDAMKMRHAVEHFVDAHVASLVGTG